MRDLPEEVESAPRSLRVSRPAAARCRSVRPRRSPSRRHRTSPCGRPPGVSCGLRGEVAVEAAGEGVARAGGVDDLGQRQRRRAERPLRRRARGTMRSPKNAVAPYSPCFTTSAFGPIARTSAAACTALVSPDSMRASPSLISSTSSSRSTWARFSRCAPRSSSSSCRRRPCVTFGICAAHAGLQHGVDVGEEEVLAVCVGRRNLGREGSRRRSGRCPASAPRSGCRCRRRSSGS